MSARDINRVPETGMTHVYVRVPVKIKKALILHAEARNITMGAIIQELIDGAITPTGRPRRQRG